MKDSKYKRVYDIVCEEFKKTDDFCHGLYDESYSTLLVFESAKKIIERGNLNVDKDVVLISALLHDIGKAYLDGHKMFGKEGLLKEYKIEWRKHAEMSKEYARNILTRLGYPEHFIERVCEIVGLHDKRDLPEKNKELMIVQDADLIADIGFLGFIRPFLFSGKFKSQSIADSINKLNTNSDYIKIENKLNLDISKEILHERIILEKQFKKLLESSYF